MRIELVAQGGAGQRSLAAAIKRHVRAKSFDRVDVAAAYATKQGIRALEHVLGGPPPVSRWVVGLDDAITQPEAIAYLATLAGAQLHVAKLTPERRFHPKLYHFWQADTPDRSLLVVGSANLTDRGMQKNAEAAVLVVSEIAAEVRSAHAAFEELWEVGLPLAAGQLADYTARYTRAKAARRVVEQAGDAPAEPPATAPVSETIPGTNTREAVLALAVAKIAAAQPDGRCSLDLAYERIPQMVALTPIDYVPYKGQGNPRWVQIVRNIQSNSSNPGPGSTNFIARGLLRGIGGGYEITDLGRTYIQGR